MPVKKNKKQEITLDQKRTMATRLMTISLRADDYIYENKPILIKEAQRYQKEMASLKNKCNDERHLQVIEKLTSYMKYIIKEQSPENIDEGKPTAEKSNEKLESGDLHHPNCESGYNGAIVTEMEKSISNLTILDPKQITKSSTDINYTNYQTMEKENYVCNGVINEINNRNNTNLTNDINKSVSDSLNAAYKDKKIMDGNYINVGDKNTILAVPRNNTNLDNQQEFGTQVQNNITKKVKIQKTNVKRENKNKINYKDIANKDQKKIGNRKNKKNVIKKSDLKKGKLQNKRKSSIKRKREIVDLSWVENVKLVREVDNEEFEMFDDLDESFWNDTSLPPNMDHIDFTYDNFNIWIN